VQNKDGRGTIVFNANGQVSPQIAKAAVMFNRGNSAAAPMFVQIERVKEVSDLIRRTKDALAK
jgi:hypothetical protein